MPREGDRVVDNVIGGAQEVAAIDWTAFAERRFVLILEAKNYYTKIRIER